MEDAARGVDCERGTAEDTPQDDLEGVVLEIAEDHISHGKIQQPRQGLHLLPVICTNEISCAGGKELTEIGRQAKVCRVQREKLAGLLTLSGREMPTVRRRTAQVNGQVGSNVVVAFHSREFPLEHEGSVNLAALRHAMLSYGRKVWILPR